MNSIYTTLNLYYPQSHPFTSFSTSPPNHNISLLSLIFISALSRAPLPSGAPKPLYTVGGDGLSGGGHVLVMLGGACNFGPGWDLT
jgi:hypothetical protein